MDRYGRVGRREIFNIFDTHELHVTEHFIQALVTLLQEALPEN